MDETRRILRHLLATIAYRTALCLRDAPSGFADFRPGNGVRPPAELIRHMTGLMAFTRSLLIGGTRQEIPPLDWPGEVARLEAALGDLQAPSRPPPPGRTIPWPPCRGPWPMR